MLPGGRGHAAVVLFDPTPALVPLDLNVEPPAVIGPNPVVTLPPDSDGDGVDDVTQQELAGFAQDHPKPPALGAALAVTEDLVLVTASNFEEVILWNPLTGGLVPVFVENPESAGAPAANPYPLLPPPGTGGYRTAISTRRCIAPSDARNPLGPVSSTGDPTPMEPRCDDSEPSYYTRFTAGAAVAAGHLFVATSNLNTIGSRFDPGTVLVYELDLTLTPLRARPDPEVPVIFTAGYNPTSMASYRTAAGRELVLVTVSGAIGIGTGDDNVWTPGYVDVIDAESRRRIATIPLGMAGPSGSLDPHPQLRIAVSGASSHRRLYAVDLGGLDDPRLYPPREPVPALDGSDAELPDARLLSASDPLTIPGLDGGPHPRVCNGVTDVALNVVGSHAFVTDHCDGSLAIIGIDLDAAVPRERFELQQVEPLLAPLGPASLDELRSPSAIAVRPGVPGLDYQGPDVYFIGGLPEGEVCGVRVDSFAPQP